MAMILVTGKHFAQLWNFQNFTQGGARSPKTKSSKNHYRVIQHFEGPGRQETITSKKNFIYHPYQNGDLKRKITQ